MDWKKLFKPHILERGYNYYRDGAVENLNIEDDVINADVIGTEVYEVEISLNSERVTDMYCSCPYAEDGNNCKHMAAVLYEWSENGAARGKTHKIEADSPLFSTAFTENSCRKKSTAVEQLVAEADIDAVRAFLAAVLADDEKLLMRFYNTVNKPSTADVKLYIRQADAIADIYLGRERFISYRKAGYFISELEEIIDEDVHLMTDKGSYMSAFEVANHIFVMLGEVDMDDSDGYTGMLALKIYGLWEDLLASVDADEKRKMFDWFTSHLDGSVMDYLEEYIEHIIMDEFNEEEYKEAKLSFVEGMIEKSRKKDSDWAHGYYTGKWVLRYLKLLEEGNAPPSQIEEICQKHKDNSDVRRYLIDSYLSKKDYDRTIELLDESILLDSEYHGLVADYSLKKKEIYLLQGDTDAYVDQLWKLALEHRAGDLEIYRELKSQYSAEEWCEKREEIFKNLPPRSDIDRLFLEEKLYDRLLTYVINAHGLRALQTYENVLKKDYPGQLLEKYKTELERMAIHTSDRNQYAYMVSLLRKMQGYERGDEIVQKIAEDWRVKYKNRRAMMDELRKL